jgi:hypothetical protein
MDIKSYRGRRREGEDRKAMLDLEFRLVIFLNHPSL